MRQRLQTMHPQNLSSSGREIKRKIKGDSKNVKSW